MVRPPRKSLFFEPKRFKKHVSNKNASKRGPSDDFGPSKCLQGRHHDDFCPKRLPKGCLRGGRWRVKINPFFNLGPVLGPTWPSGAPRLDFGSIFDRFWLIFEGILVGF